MSISRITAAAKLIVVSSLCLAHLAQADVLVLKNGDRITGEIKRIWDDEITIEPEYADEFEVDMPVVAYIESDRDFEIDFQDGRSILAKFGGLAADGDQIITSSTESFEISLAEVLELDEPEDRYDWETNVDFSSNLNKGNTDSSNTKMRADGMFKHGDHRHRGEMTFFREELAGVSTQQQDYYVYDYNWLFNDPWFFTGQLTYEKNPIIELASRVILSAGVGYDIWSTPRKDLSVQLGIGYQNEEFTTFIDRDDESAVLVWNLRYQQDFFGDDMELFHNHSITKNISGRTNTSYNTSTGLRFEITDLLYANVSLDYDYETESAITATNEDLTLVFGLGLEFE